MYVAIVATLKKTVELCKSVGFDDAWLTITICLTRVDVSESDKDASSLETELNNVVAAVMIDVTKHKYLHVRAGRADHIDKNDLLGESVVAAFPSASPDIREAGNCLAAECNTAAVFHLMRAVEWGLRALCVDLGVRRIVIRTRNPKKVKYRLIEYSEWETILNQLQGRVDAKLKRVKRGRVKQLYQEFYYPALQDIRGIRDAWRNHTMHTRSEYTAQDADAILEHVKRLMVNLATRVKEV